MVERDLKDGREGRSETITFRRVLSFVSSMKPNYADHTGYYDTHKNDEKGHRDCHHPLMSALSIFARFMLMCSSLTDVGVS